MCILRSAEENLFFSTAKVKWSFNIRVRVHMHTYVRTLLLLPPKYHKDKKWLFINYYYYLNKEQRYIFKKFRFNF